MAGSGGFDSGWLLSRFISVPRAVKKDPELYDLLSLVDALRIGRVREKKMAEEELRNRMERYAGS